MCEGVCPNAGTENAGPENADPENEGSHRIWKMQDHDVSEKRLKMNGHYSSKKTIESCLSAVVGSS